MSDVLFIFPTDCGEFNVGISSMAAVLKQKGFSTSLYLIDMFKEAEATARLEEAIRRENPTLIAFSIVSNYWTYMRGCLDLVKKITDLPVVVGGWHATLAPEVVMEHPSVDFICIGEGEYALLDLMERLADNSDTSAIPNIWVKRNGRIIRNPLRPLIADLDRLPEPDRSFLDYQDILNRGASSILGNWGIKKVASFVFGRGCYFNCGYCCNESARKKYNVSPKEYVRKRSVKAAIEEIDHVTSSYDVEWLDFWDEDFTLHREWFREFTKEYGRKFNFPFVAMARPRQVLHDEMKMLRDANCRVLLMGVESGNEAYRRKYMHRNETNEDILNAFRLARECGIATVSTNMAGLPFETEDGVEMTLALNELLQPDFFYLFTFNPYFGTEFYDLAKENGLLLHNGPGQNYHTNAGPLVKGIAPERFLELQRRAAEMQSKFDDLRRKRYPELFVEK